MLTHGSRTAVECPSDTRTIRSSALCKRGQIELQFLGVRVLPREARAEDPR